MDFLIAILFFIVLSVLLLYALIYIRIYTSPLKKIPGLPITRPIFGTYIEYLESGCHLLDFIKDDVIKYGPIRISYVFFGKIRLNISVPVWIKVKRVFHVMLCFKNDFRANNLACFIDE